MGRRQITAGLVSFVMVVSAFLVPFAGMSVYAGAAGTDVLSGSCGATEDDHVEWTLIDNTLTISGTGDMCDYGGGEYAPWQDYTYFSVIINEGVTKIGNCAFSDSYISFVDIPESVETIGNSAFSDTTYLSFVKGMKGLKEIGEGAFAYSGIEAIILPEGLETIGRSAFNRSQLKSIAIPEGIETIEASMFGSCSTLQEITLPASLKTINQMAFNIPNGTINKIFYKGTQEQWAAITIGQYNRALETAVSMGRIQYNTGDTYYCGDNLQWEVNSDGELIIKGEGGMTNYTSDSGNNPAPWILMRSIIKSIRIKEHVTSVGTYAFYGCNKAKEIYFEGNAPSFGEPCFSRVTATAYYPENDPTWTEDVRQNYGGTITWVPWTPTGIGVIADGACGPNLIWSLDEEGTLTISGTGNMDHYDLSSASTSPPWFDHNAEIKKVVIEDGVTAIGENAFKGFGLLSEVELPSSVTVIGKEAFRSCQLLEEISLPDGIEELRENCFNDDVRLKKVFLPSSIRIIEENAFANDKITHVFYEGDKDAWLDILIYPTGNDAVDYLKSKVHFNAEDINDFPQKDWWGFPNTDITKNHHIDGYMWKSVLGINIIDRFSGWYFGDDDTKNGLCAGMAETAMLFDQGYLNCTDFEQETAPSRVYDVKKNAYNRDADMTAEEMIKLSFILQYVPEFHEKIFTTNVNKYDELCTAVRQYTQTRLEPVYVCLQGIDGNHAVWAYALEEEDEYCDIYLYDCNDPKYPQILRFLKSNGSITGLQYLNPDNTHEFDNVSYASNIDEVSLAIATYHSLTPITPFVSLREEGYLLAAVSDGITYLNESFNNLIPIRTTNGSEADKPEIYYCKADNAISVCNNEATGQSIAFTDDVSTLEITLPQNAAAEYEDYCLDMHCAEGDTLAGTYTTVSGEETVNIGLSSNTAEETRFDFSGNELVITGQSELEITVDYHDIITSAEINVNEDGAVHIKTDNTEEDDVQLVVSIDEDNDGICEEDNTYNLSNDQLTTLTEENVQIAFELDDTVNNDPENPQFMYTGSLIEPAFDLYIGDTQLIENTDFTVRFSDNTNVGSAKIIIKGIGSYNGKIEKAFEITPKDIIPNIVLSNDSFEYTGEEIIPSVTVLCNDEQLLENIDYETAFEDNIEPGTATVTVTCIGNYSGSATKEFTINKVLTGLWKKDRTGWWYLWEDGTYPKNKFEIIEGVTYYFNASGYMVTGWRIIDGKWYYFNASGAMMTGWQRLGGVWYYMNSNGVMVTGWQNIGGVWYYFNNSGAMQTGWRQLGGVWYYMNPSGAMVTGWQSIGGKWYYFNAGGAMQTGWQQIGDVWYYMNSSGAMVTGWLKLGNTWYYMNASGAMVTGRQQIDGMWYTFSSSGAMQ